MSLTWAVFEILGTVAFAFSGAAVGLARGMDVFGIALLSVVTAVGGGILRDVLAGIFPPFALRGPDGIIFALMTAAAVCIGFRHFHIPHRGRKLVLFCLSCFRYGRSCRFHGDRCDDGDRQLSRLPVCASRSARAHYGGGRRYSS